MSPANNAGTSDGFGGPVRVRGRDWMRVRVRGRDWTIEACVRAEDCSSIRLRGSSRQGTITLLTPFDRLVPLTRLARPRVVTPRRWLHDLDRASLSLRPFGSLPAAANAPIRLLPYQLEPAMAIARDGISHLLIADSVGLGKTIQAGLGLLELVRHDESCRALVLAPAGLREQWQIELSTKVGLTTVLADARWLRTLSAERPAHLNPWSMPGIYIASHDLVKRPEVLRSIEQVTWDAVVIDEAHAATSGTDRRAALHAIALRARHVVLLTATPHDGNPHEREALVRIGRPPDGNDPLLMFRRSRSDVQESTSRRTRVLAVTPSPAEHQMYDLLERYSRRVWDEANARDDERARLVSIVLRKRALSSAGSLLSSIERRLAMLTERTQEWQPSLPLEGDKDEDPIADAAPGADLGAPGLGDARRERRWLIRIAKAAEEAAVDERKTRRLLRFLSRVKEPVIVFTEYRDTLRRLAECLVDPRRSVLQLHGGLTARERAAVQRAFNDRGGTLLATDAASEGLNLHHRCRVVVHFELPWNPSRLEQRAGRVDRLGQTRVVHELAFVAAHTAERLVIAPLTLRLAAAGAVGRRALSALSESSVAAAVMSGGPPPQPKDAAEPSPSCAVPAAGFAALARTEAMRLERHRQLAARSPSPREAGSPAIVVTRIRSGRIAPGLYFVFAVALEAGDGVTVHLEPRVIHAELTPAGNRALSASRGHLQDVIAALATTEDAVLAEIARSHDPGSLDRVWAFAEARSRRLQQRHQAIANVMAGGIPLASQLLVQAGLFDRRSLRAAARQAETMRALDDDLRDRQAAAQRTNTSRRTAELLAAVHVTWRP